MNNDLNFFTDTCSIKISDSLFGISDSQNKPNNPRNNNRKNEINKNIPLNIHTEDHTATWENREVTIKNQSNQDIHVIAIDGCVMDNNYKIESKDIDGIIKQEIPKKCDAMLISSDVLYFIEFKNINRDLKNRTKAQEKACDQLCHTIKIFKETHNNKFNEIPNENKKAYIIHSKEPDFHKPILYIKQKLFEARQKYKIKENIKIEITNEIEIPPHPNLVLQTS